MNAPLAASDGNAEGEQVPVKARSYNSEVQIRLATADDAVLVASVVYRAFAEYEPLYTRGGFAATTPGPQQVKGRLREGPIWVAIQDDLIVGTVGAAPRAEALYVRGMAVAPEARGQGIGESLLACVECFAIEQGYQRLFLSTTPFLTPAIRLYERHGFRRSQHSSDEDVGPHDLFGTPLFTMVKELARK